MELEDAIMAAIRRIVRAIDLRSREIAAKAGVTGPQLVTLRAIQKLGNASLSELSREVSIGQATITGIVDRLERAELALRSRDPGDRRKIAVSVTGKGLALLDTAPPLLQEKFQIELAKLAQWEQTAMLATLQRVASMMDAEDLEAAPLLEVREVQPDGSLSGQEPQ